MLSEAAKDEVLAAQSKHPYLGSKSGVLLRQCDRRHGDPSTTLQP
jgi:hypothetical protein